MFAAFSTFTLAAISTRLTVRKKIASQAHTHMLYILGYTHLTHTHTHTWRFVGFLPRTSKCGSFLARRLRGMLSPSPFKRTWNTYNKKQQLKWYLDACTCFPVQRTFGRPRGDAHECGEVCTNKHTHNRTQKLARARAGDTDYIYLLHRARCKHTRARAL